MDIAQKTTGTLLNEFHTATLKLMYIGDKYAIVQRIDDLIEALLSRDIDIVNISPRFALVQHKYYALARILEELWWAVEEVIKLREANEDDIDMIKRSGYAALKAFELNKQRTDLIQEIDTILGEARFTFLEKSFA